MKWTTHNHLALPCTIRLSISLTNCYKFLRHSNSNDFEIRSIHERKPIRTDKCEEKDPGKKKRK